MANKTLSELRDVVEKVLHDWEVSPTQKTQYIALRDKERDRYTVLLLQARHKLNIAHAMFYLAIKNDKIYVEFDSAKDGIATEFLAYGVPKEQIVLAFYPPEMREMGEFAVK